MTEVEDQWRLREPELVKDLDSLKPAQPLDLVKDLDSLKLDLEEVPARIPFLLVRIRIPRQPLEPREDFLDMFADLTVNNARDARGQTPPSELRTPTAGWISTWASLFACCGRTTKVPYDWF